MVEVVKSVMNFRAAYGKEHDMSFIIAWMMDIVEDIHLYDFPAGHNFQTYQRTIRMSKCNYQCAKILNIIKNIKENVRRAMMLGISHLDDRSLFSSLKDELILTHTRWKYVKNPTKHHLFHAPSFYESKGSLLRSYLAFSRNVTQSTTVSFLSFVAQAFLQTSQQTQQWNKWFSITSATMSVKIRK